MAHEIKVEQEITSSPPAKISYEEFLAQSDEDTYAEWVDGEVIEMSPASDKHQDVVGFLGPLFRFWVEAHDLGVVRLAPFQMKTGPGLPGREPDILFLSKENLSRLKKAYLDGPADLVIEVISPESRSRDRGDKFYEYEQGGVREYWLIDPIRRQGEFYQLEEDGIYRLTAADSQGLYRSRVLEGLWLRVEWLWQEPMPRLMDVLKEWGLV